MFFVTLKKNSIFSKEQSGYVLVAANFQIFILHLSDLVELTSIEKSLVVFRDLKSAILDLKRGFGTTSVIKMSSLSFAILNTSHFLCFSLAWLGNAFGDKWDFRLSPYHFALFINFAFIIFLHLKKNNRFFFD